MLKFRRAVCGFGLLLIAGCTSASITSEREVKPQEKYINIAIGDVSMEGEIWKHLLPHLRQGMEARFREDKSFQQVLPKIEGDLPNNTLVVNAQVTEVDEGSTAARVLIGFGAGSASVTGRIALEDGSRKPIMSFTARESYSGGAGIGGWDMVRLEELMKKLGVSVAYSVTRWSQGKGLRDPEAGG